MDDLFTYCYLVQRGKPAASIAVHKRDLKLAEMIVSKEGLNYYIEILADEWVTFWVYQHPHILNVIKTIPQVPKSEYEHWVLGKLFGYDDSSIADFLSNQL